LKQAGAAVLTPGGGQAGRMGGWYRVAANIAGIATGLNLLGDGQTIYQMIDVGGDEVGATLAAIGPEDGSPGSDEMIKDIELIGRIGIGGGIGLEMATGRKEQIRDAIVDVLQGVINNPPTISKADIAQKLGQFSGVEIQIGQEGGASEAQSATQPTEMEQGSETGPVDTSEGLARIIDAMIMEDVLGFKGTDLPNMGDPPLIIPPEVEEEEEEEEEEEAGSGRGRGQYRRRPGYDITYTSRPRFATIDPQTYRMQQRQARRNRAQAGRQAARQQRRDRFDRWQQARIDNRARRQQERLSEAKKKDGKE
jgi:hypothetical protein